MRSWFRPQEEEPRQPRELPGVCIEAFAQGMFCLRLHQMGQIGVSEVLDFVFLPSGWRLVLLVFLVKMLGDVWRWALHEDPLVHKPSASLRRGHLPGASHGGGALQHPALPR